MKMNITQWANHNGMTPDEFKNEIAATMAAVGGMELDSNGDESKDMVAFTVADSDYVYQVMVRRVKPSNGHLEPPANTELTEGDRT
jgi:hypothetical protein